MNRKNWSREAYIKYALEAEVAQSRQQKAEKPVPVKYIDSDYKLPFNGTRGRR